MRLGVPKEYFIEGIDPEVEKAVRAAIEDYKSQGAEIVEVSLPHTKYAVAVYYIIATAECSANLARFDGVRYGKRAENPKDILDMYGRTRAEGFGAEVKRRIILGTYVLSSGYYDAYYNRAQKVRHLIARGFPARLRAVRRAAHAHLAHAARSRSASARRTRCRCTSPTSSPSP